MSEKYRIIDWKQFQGILRNKIFDAYSADNTFGRLWALTTEKLDKVMEKSAEKVLEKK